LQPDPCSGRQEKIEFTFQYRLGAARGNIGMQNGGVSSGELWTNGCDS